MNGRWRNLVVVGVALSPEYVYTIGPGALMPDDLRYGVLRPGRPEDMVMRGPSYQWHLGGGSET